MDPLNQSISDGLVEVQTALQQRSHQYDELMLNQANKVKNVKAAAEKRISANKAGQDKGADQDKGAGGGVSVGPKDITQDSGAAASQDKRLDTVESETSKAVPPTTITARSTTSTATTPSSVAHTTQPPPPIHKKRSFMSKHFGVSL